MIKIHELSQHDSYNERDDNDNTNANYNNAHDSTNYQPNLINKASLSIIRCCLPGSVNNGRSNARQAYESLSSPLNNVVKPGKTRSEGQGDTYIIQHTSFYQG